VNRFQIATFGMFLAGAIVGCSSFGVSTPSGSTPNALPVLNAAFVKHAGRIAFPNVGVPTVDALSGAGLEPNSTAGANDLETAGVDVGSGGPYDGMLASITAYLPTQVKLPGTSSAPSSVFAPYLSPTNGSCLTVGILYADMGSGTTASLVAKDTCANTVLYSTPITSSFVSTYVQQFVTPANVTVPVIKVLVYTSDPTPTASSTWNAYLYDLTTQAYDLVATRKGISTTLAGGTLWTSSIRTGSCPVLPQISVVSSYLYDGANQTYTAVAPSLTGTTSTPLPTASDSCFKSAKPPATYTYVLAHPNDMWNVVSATAAPSPTPVPTSTPFLVTVANGGSGALPDGSGSVSFGAGALPYDAYVTLTYMPTASASPPSANWTTLGPQLHIAFAPAASPSPAVAHLAAATATPSASSTPIPPGSVTISFDIPQSTKAQLGSQTMTEALVGDATDLLPIVPQAPIIVGTGTGAVLATILIKNYNFAKISNLKSIDVFNLVQSRKSTICPVAANLGLRYWSYASQTWAMGAPPTSFIHPLVLFHGITSCVEETFPAPTIEGIQAEGGYDAVIGVDYDWTKIPDQNIPSIVTNLNALGPFQHIDLMAHSYGSIISMGVAPQLNAKSIDNMIFVNGPLNGSFLQNPDFVNSYALFWPNELNILDPNLKAQTFALQFNTKTWRTAFMPNDPEVAGFRAALEKAPDAPIQVIKIASTLPFPLPVLGNVTDLYTAINLGAAPGPNDGIVGQSSAQSSDVVGTANTVNLANQAYILPKTFTLTSPSTDHITSVMDPSIDSTGIANNLATVFANSDYSSQTLPAIGGAYVVMKGVGSTHLLGFLDTANPGSTITVDTNSVPANLTISPSTVSTVTSLGNASASNYMSIELTSDSHPALPSLDPTKFGSEPPTAFVRFNYTDSMGTITDAYSLAYYLLPSGCTQYTFPCTPAANSMSLEGRAALPMRAAASRVPRLRVLFFPKRATR
jgi:hypothetical protein